VRICILRTGDAIPEVAERRGEFAAWIREGVGEEWTGEWVEHDVRVCPPMEVGADVAAVVVTGSPSSVTERAPWMLETESLIRRLHTAQVPLLGICFGHQIIAQALGGRVTRNPKGREIGTVRVARPRDAGDPLFDGLPEELVVQATHVDTVAELPPGAKLLGSTSLESHAAFAVGPTTRCVQFHPEIDADVMRGYIRARAHLMRAEGLCPDTAHGLVEEVHHGAAVLRNFVRHFVHPRTTHRESPQRAPQQPSSPRSPATVLSARGT
jgi:GMP synthase (glutamine-hydrolysing)